MNDWLIKQYSRNGGCREVRKELEACKSDTDMLALYVKHPTWCLERNFPELDVLRSARQQAETMGVYIDKEFRGEIFSSKQAYVFHNCKGHINVEMDYENAVIPMLYFANGCSLHVVCEQDNNPKIRVPLYVYGSSIVTFGGKGAKFNTTTY